MKTLLFIPGFGDSLKSHNYAAVLKAYESRGFNTKFVAINWKRTTPMDWLREFNKTYSKYKASQTVIAGFSFGAVTAFLAAAERNPAELWLCSLSPYFVGDNPSLNNLKFIGKRRAKVFDEINFPQLAKQIQCHTRIMYGELESGGIDLRAQKAHKLIKNSVLIKVPDTIHKIDEPKYVQAIKHA